MERADGLPRNLHVMRASWAFGHGFIAGENLLDFTHWMDSVVAGYRLLSNQLQEPLIVRCLQSDWVLVNALASYDLSKVKWTELRKAAPSSELEALTTFIRALITSTLAARSGEKNVKA